MEDQQLHICFLVKIRDDFYSEAAIARHLIRMKIARLRREIDLKTMDGAISVVYQGEELLGTEFWDEINQVYPRLDELLQGRPTEEHLPLNRCRLKLQPVNEQVLYELKSVAPLRPLHIKRLLPLKSFVREWMLMRYRMMKFEAYLGKRLARENLAEWEELLEEPLRSTVGPDRVRAIVEGDLVHVLTESGCGSS